MASPQVIMAVRFLRHFRRSSTSKVNFSVLTERCQSYHKILHFQENGYNVYVNFGDHGSLMDVSFHA